MKKALFILAVMLIAAPAYNQSSRRNANSNATARESQRRTNHTYTSNRSDTRHHANRTYTQTRTRNSDGNRPAHSYSKNRNSNNYHRTSTTPTHHHNSRYYRTNYVSTRGYHGRHAVSHSYRYAPAHKSYRVRHYQYRYPNHVHACWTRDMHHYYVKTYPKFQVHYSIGHHIDIISAYNAEYHYGRVKTVYGKVTDVFYSRETDEYYLYIGPHYPYYDFAVVVPGYLAREKARHPGQYFDNQHIAVTGLISSFDGKPEIVVHKNNQLALY